MVGVVGLGLVGMALVSRLHAAGFKTIGFDLRAPARAAYAEQAGSHGQVAKSMQALAAEVPCVVLAVFNSDDVLAVVEGNDEGKNEGDSGLISAGIVRCIVDCSTGTPDVLRDLSRRLQVRGIDFIEAPLSGSSQQIAAGQATALLGGTVEALERHQVVLSALATKQIHAGVAGMGASAKLATNLVLGLNRAALAEGMVFAQSMGLDAAQFLQMVLNSPASSGAALAKGQKMVDGDFAPQSRIAQHLKDVRLMLASAAQNGQRLPLSEAHVALMQAAVHMGDGELDNAAIISQIRREKSN